MASLGTRDELSGPAAEQPAPAGTPVMPVHLYGRTAVVGPYLTPGRPGAPCGHCLARRWQSVRPRQVREALERGGRTHAVGEPPYATAFVTDALTSLVVRAAEHEPENEHAACPPVRLLDMENLRVHTFQLLPDPECPVCGERAPDTAEAAVLELEPSPKTSVDSFRGRGVHDYDLPEDALVNPVCGALGLSVVRELDSPTTAATFGKMETRTGTYLHEAYWGGHADAYGDSVRVGLLEGLERYAGMRSRAKAVGTSASLGALRARKVAALDPRDCGLYSDELYAEYEREGRITPFAEDREIPWVWGYSLRDKAPLLVPEALTYWHAVPLSERFVQECSNGCASGSSPAEAVYHGLMELVERDAFLIAWYGRIALPEIDPRAARSAAVRHMTERLAMYGYEARFFDARMTLPIPVVIAAAVGADGGLCFGAGASLDPEDAMRAGMAEIATDAPHLRRRTEWRRTELEAMADDFGKVAALHDHPLLYGLPRMRPYASFLLGKPGAPRGPLVAPADLDPAARGTLVPGTDLRDDLEHCVAAVTDAGFDVVVVDQTLPQQRELGLHTVSVIVPGLLPIDFGWGRQRALGMDRLRTAPRAAGLRDRDLDPADLNPAPHPFP
ncbi:MULTISPECIES: TOMM precursor leader peptide-binding protein [Streptomyces]|uniref:TOMM precursor leader peptide-binding protein n=1 Tax=Streptomyces TaxID=1883 RepID=UPI0027E52900|nr:TOMM precursor leader peptide-binding protein [Streptomyces sp. GbtcB7]